MWRIGAAGGLSAALALAQFLVPIAGAVLSLFAPLPLLWLVRGARRLHGRLDRKGAEPAEPGGDGVPRPAFPAWWAPAAALLAAGLPFLVVGPPMALSLLAQFAPLTAGLALGLAQGRSLTTTVVSATAATVTVGLAALLTRSGFDPAAARTAVAAQVEEAVAAAFARAGGDGVETAPLAAVFVRLLPGLAVVGTMGAAWVNLLALRWLAGAGRAPARGRAAPRVEKGGRETPRPTLAVLPPPLDDWSLWAAPEPLVFVLVLGGGALLLESPAATTVGLNLLVVVGFVYFLQGLAILGFFFRVKGVPFVLRAAGYVLIGAQQLLPLVVAAVGLADLWVDFRRRVLRAPRDSRLRGDSWGDRQDGGSADDSDNGGNGS